MKPAAVIAVLLATNVAGAFAAGPIYRCGAGGTVYSQVPCSEGRLIESADPRSAAQRAEAKRMVERERKAAADLERDRRAQEAEQAASAASATGINTRPARPEPVPASKAPTKSQAKGTVLKKDVVAVEPVSRKKRSKKPVSPPASAPVSRVSTWQRVADAGIWPTRTLAIRCDRG